MPEIVWQDDEKVSRFHDQEQHRGKVVGYLCSELIEHVVKRSDVSSHLLR